MSEETRQGSATVSARKFDGTEHRRWQAQLVRRENSLLVFDARFDEEVRHPLLGVIPRGTISLEYYWLDRWYNVFRFLLPDGGLRNFYCNVNLPPEFDGGTMSYVDLELDVLVWPDFSYKVLDEDEFAAHAIKYNYPDYIKNRAPQALDELINLIETRRFPFA